jgi:hypothetical protein
MRTTWGVSLEQPADALVTMPASAGDRGGARSSLHWIRPACARPAVKARAAHPGRTARLAAKDDVDAHAVFTAEPLCARDEAPVAAPVTLGVALLPMPGQRHASELALVTHQASQP